MDKLKAWAVDYLHMFKWNALMYYHRNPPKEYVNNNNVNKPAIILIPGIRELWGFMKPIGDLLSANGYPVFIVPELGHNYHTVANSAKFVREIIEKNNLQNVIIIGHSKGGIIGKYLLTYDNKDKRIIKLIAVATPFGGSPLVKFVPKIAFKELAKESEVIKDLQKHEEVNQDIISLYAKFDNHILSQESSILEDGENIEMPVSGHHKILFDKPTQEKILEVVEKISL